MSTYHTKKRKLRVTNVLTCAQCGTPNRSEVSRILLSWFPGLQGNALVRPIITIVDPYLNLFRNTVPPVFGLDLSPILAILLLQAFGSVRCSLPFINFILLPQSVSFIGHIDVIGLLPFNLSNTKIRSTDSHPSISISSSGYDCSWS